MSALLGPWGTNKGYKNPQRDLSLSTFSDIPPVWAALSRTSSTPLALSGLTKAMRETVKFMQTFNGFHFISRFMTDFWPNIIVIQHIFFQKLQESTYGTKIAFLYLCGNIIIHSSRICHDLLQPNSNKQLLTNTISLFILLLTLMTPQKP